MVSHALLFLNTPMREVVQLTDEIRHDRYSILRSVFRKGNAAPLDETHSLRQQLRTVVLPPGAYSVGRTIERLGLHEGELVVTALRRDGIVGRDPDPETRLREGDVLVLYGTPEQLELTESRLLMG
jgi:CPA2 family monovalent cation:H+ antiporter-2